MTAADTTIEARAERLAQARAHLHCEHCGAAWPHPWPSNGCKRASVPTRCTDDHRTPAEQRNAVLDALATAYGLLLDEEESDEHPVPIRSYVRVAYQQFQRRSKGASL